jgi:4-amino-4-deoxy-L-arabinose transferase-like glycosyltransferase
VAIAAILAGIGLGDHLYWDDEANTALFARNLIEHGELTGWDGVNLAGYRQGAELDENLINVYMPRLQYYVAAAGFLLFGETTVGGRLPFVIAGLLGIVALAFLARNLLGDRLSSHLPALLVAVSPAYLLYIRNCRYYALGALLVIVLLGAFAGTLESRRQQIRDYLLAIAATALLFATNYFNAVCALAALPLFFALRTHRTRQHLHLLGAIYATGALAGAWVYLAMSPFGSEVLREDTAPAVERFFTLLWWNLRDLGTFEFFPVLLTPVLFAPFYSQRLRGTRPLALKGLALAGMMTVMVVVTVWFTPQPVSGSVIADMRYLVPLIPLGAIVSAVALVILWRLWRLLAVAAAAVLIFSNVLHLGFLGGFNAFLEPKGAQCTLCRYVIETIEDHETTTEALVAHLEQLPAGTEVLIVPTFMAYPPMYYLPELHYCCQLKQEHALREDLRAELPGYVFWEQATPSVGLINSQPPGTTSGPLTIAGHQLGFFRIVGRIPVQSKDTSRPEIPWHAFSQQEIDAWKHHDYLVVDIWQDERGSR